MNAEHRFRHYFDFVPPSTESTPLPEDVLSLMNRSIELVNLIYWEPTPVPGSNGKVIHDQSQVGLRNEGRVARPQGPLPDIGSRQEIDMEDDDAEEDDADDDDAAPARLRLKWLRVADEKARRAYLSRMIAGPSRRLDE